MIRKSDGRLGINSSINLIEGIVLMVFLVPITYFDIKQKRIPDPLVFAGILALLVSRLLTGSLTYWFIIDALIGFGIIGLLYFFSKGKIGLGDAKLSAFIAIILGFWAWSMAIFLASLTGLVFLLTMIRSGRMTRKQSIPFAPFLALGGLVAFLLRPQITTLFASTMSG